MSENFYGEIKAFPYDFVPDEWLPCFGQQLLISQYQALFAVIKNLYDPPDNPNPSRFFYLPDLRGVVPVGADIIENKIKVNQKGGTETVIVNEDQLPAHSHNIKAYKRAGGKLPSDNIPSDKTYLTDGESVIQNLPVFMFSTAEPPQTSLSTAAISVAGHQQAHENRMPYLPMQWAICADGDFPAQG